jgi:cyclophilin family peptidyl-prolyl cis-trans isomerase
LRAVRRLLPLLLLIAAGLALAACGGGKKPAAEASPVTTTATTPACSRVSAPAPKGPQHISKPKLRLDTGRTYTARVSTNCGEFTITLAVKESPKTAASFVALARRGYFDGLTFHRIVPSFVIQGGDPLGDGTGGPGYSITEAPPKALQYTRGVVAMAKTGVEPPGTSGSQFFVVTAEDAQLPPDYALLGRVTEGQDVVDRIGVLPTDQGEHPVQPVVISKIAIAEK